MFYKDQVLEASVIFLTVVDCIELTELALCLISYYYLIRYPNQYLPQSVGHDFHV